MQLYHNCVLDFFIEVKQKYIHYFGEENLYNYDQDFDNCIEYWVWHIANMGDRKRHIYEDMIHYLSFKEYNDMILIRYTDLGVDWDAYDGFYMECRSIVIDIKNDCIVLLPFRKFHNLNECESNSIENITKMIERASIVEFADKLDGSMVTARWYKDHLVVAGSKSLNPANSWRLKNYYDWINSHKNIFDMIKTGWAYTFIFEGIFPDDIHVVNYDESMIGLHLIGIRSVRYGFELPYKQVFEIADTNAVPHAKLFDTTLDEVIASLGDKKSDEAEGFVLSIDGYRVKIKYDDYVLMHHAISKLVSPNAVIRAIKEGRWDDFYAKIPQAYKPNAKETADNIIKYLKILDGIVKLWVSFIPKDIADSRKDSMVWITKNVPVEYQGKVRTLYLGQEIDYLKGVGYNDIKKYLGIE